MVHPHDQYDLHAEGSATFVPACIDHYVARFRLTAVEAQQIGATAARTGFFDLPSDLRDLPEDELDLEKFILVTSACADSDLKLSSQGRWNHVRWDCNTASELYQGPDDAPRQVRELVEEIRKVFAAHPEVANAPHNNCYL